MSFTAFRKLLEKTCGPKSNEKNAFIRYLHDLRILNMYSYLVPPFGHT